MSKDETERALKALDDDGVRAKAAAGDSAALEGFELSDAERDLVAGAAADWPEVAGFAFEGYLGASFSWTPGRGDHDLKPEDLSDKMRLAVEYVRPQPKG